MSVPKWSESGEKRPETWIRKFQNFIQSVGLVEKDSEIEWRGRAIDEETWLLGRKIQMAKRRQA